MKTKHHHHSSPLPIRLTLEQHRLLQEFNAKTGLSKSFVIRRCISYAMEKFASDSVDILTLREK
jgi:predicted DNA-binding protein